MASYPALASVPQHEPYEEEMEWKTLISNFDDLGEEQRKQKWLYPKRTITVKHKYVTKTQAATIWQFYQARAGSYEAFNYFVPNADSYVREYIGTGNSSSTSFNLPACEMTSYTVYVDGSSIAATIATGAGADGADLIKFDTAPTSGERLTITFAGRLKVHARFADDKLSFEQLYNQMVTTGVKLKGLLNE